eukprot:5106061-Pleurochrysis_carterae.AAC.2
MTVIGKWPTSLGCYDQGTASVMQLLVSFLVKCSRSYSLRWQPVQVVGSVHPSVAGGNASGQEIRAADIDHSPASTICDLFPASHGPPANQQLGRAQANKCYMEHAAADRKMSETRRRASCNKSCTIHLILRYNANG